MSRPRASTAEPGIKDTSGSPTAPDASAYEREAVLRAILDTVPDALIVINKSGIIQSFSTTAERMFGFSAAEVCGKNVSILMPSPHREMHDLYIERYLRTGERRIVGTGRVVVGQRKDGSIFPIELAVGEVRLGANRLFVGFVRDLTERQQAQRRLQELQSDITHMARVSEMGQMAASLAHEINQPLAAAANYLAACRRVMQASEASPKAEAHAQKASEQVKRATEIIRHLRGFVKKDEPDRRPERFGKVVEEASALALIGAKERGIKVVTHTPSDLPEVPIDRIQIQQVIVNLIRNAVEAMEASAVRELTVEATPFARGVAVSVSDTGPGLAPEVAQRLFQPFVTTKPRGMGVGLNICQSIIRDHGGEIWAEPNQPSGTTFRFTLPEG